MGGYLLPAGAFAGSTVANSQVKTPIIDTHMHLWDLEKLDYPWLEGRETPISHNFLVADYHQATEGCGIRKMVFVECGRAPEQYLEEVEWVMRLAQDEPRIQGIVAYFPIEKGARALPELEELTSRSLVKGIRHGVNADLLEDADFIKGVQLLAKHELSFDLNISSDLMPEAIRFIQQCSDTQFILDHMGNPRIKDQELNTWTSQMQELAKLENVCCKVSGIITKADPDHWKPDDLRPYVVTALETFGADRVMFGGDWPVVLLAGSYQDWLTALQDITETLSPSEKKRLFYANAEKVYRL